MSIWEKFGFKTEADALLDKEIRKTIDEIAVLGLQRQGRREELRKAGDASLETLETDEELGRIDREEEELHRKLESLEEKRKHK